MQEVVRFYGFEIGRKGMLCCPFHNDKTPSMKIYEESYYCFGCGVSGDVTNFVAKLFNISQYEAVKKIDYDFGLHITDRELAIPIQVRVNPEREYLLWLKNAEQIVSRYLTELHNWRVQLKPKSFSEPLNLLFTESQQKLEYINYLSEILCYGSKEEKKELYLNNKKDIEQIADRLKKLDHKKITVKRKVI